MSPMPNIRSFQPSDAASVRRLFASRLIDFANGLEDTVREYIQRSLGDDLADIPVHYLNEPGSHFWVAELDSEIVGMVGIQRRTDEEAELRRMSVATHTRRLGIGRKLLETTETFCRDQGYHRIRLTTVTFLKPAIAMYRECGYRLAGEEEYGHVAGLHFVKHLKEDR